MGVLRMVFSRSFGSFLLALVVFAGCYGGKFLKMPINADLTYKLLDTLRARQDSLAKKLEDISDVISREREEKLRGRAEIMIKMGELEESLEILFHKLDDNLQLLSELRAASTLGPPSIQAVDTTDTTRTPRADSTRALPRLVRTGESGKLFEDAYMDLTLGNLKLAIQGFKNYIVRYPGGAKISDTHYYLGECYYTTEKYLEAVGEFQYVIREFPDSRLVPAAYLKSGFCYAKLEEKSLAEKAFRELISKYPHTEEAERARIALRDLGG